MKANLQTLIWAGAVWLVSVSAATAAPLGSGWTYQGKLDLLGIPLNDTADLEFSLYDALAAGIQVGSTVMVNNVTVVDGLFTVELDFGVIAFNGDARWLEITVRSPAGAGVFTTLAPRQPLTAAPYALQTRGIFVNAAGNVGIGTTAPTSALDIAGGNISLNGGWLSGDGENEGVFVTNGGIVGIGTTSPRADLKLDVVGRIAPDFGTTTDATYRFGNGAENTGFSSPGNGEISLITSGSERVRISSSGNVGIGDSTPDGKLEVRQTGTADIFNLYDNTTNVLTVRDGGNVGIGTTTPSAKLDVVGTTELNGDLSVSGNDLFVDASTGEVGIGTSTPSNTLHVTANKSGASIANHVVRIVNTGSSQRHVLALKMDATAPGPGNNFVTFFNSNNDGLGAIEGSGLGGVIYKSGGADFAEYMPRLHHDEHIEPGDIVGVFGGRIAKQTNGADWVMAVSTTPITLGNMQKSQELEALHETVAFLGQVPVKVRGPVAVGDYVIASGMEDGTAIAIPFQQIDPASGHLIVGRAWAASDDPGVKLINTVVGLPGSASTTAALARTVRAQQDQIGKLAGRLAELESLVEELAATNGVTRLSLAK